MQINRETTPDTKCFNGTIEHKKNTWKKNDKKLPLLKINEKKKFKDSFENVLDY